MHFHNLPRSCNCIRSWLTLVALLAAMATSRAYADLCPTDPSKIAPGQCGCGIPDTDSDMDGIADCIDGCPNDPNKLTPGQCGCGQLDTDVDMDGVADCCSTITNPGQGDCNGDTVGDMCEIAFGAADCNGNGIPDTCDIAHLTSLDQNANGVPDECEVDGPGVPFCFGDGSGTACPCSNPGQPGRGCNNTRAQGGARLTSSGIPSISADTLVLTSSGAPLFSPGLFFQGSTSAAPGVLFGNGLRCVGGSTPRLEIKIAGSTGASSTSVPIHVLGSNAAGDVRNYQLWYRDAPSFGACLQGFNLTNALSLTWLP